LPIVTYPTSIWRPRWGEYIGISSRSSATENYSPWSIVLRYLRDPSFIHLGRTPICDRRTDERIDV